MDTHQSTAATGTAKAPATYATAHNRLKPVDLPRIKKPVLGLYPTAGQITSSEQEAMLKGSIPQIEMVHLPTSFHMIHLLHARECAERTLAHCARYDDMTVKEP